MLDFGVGSEIIGSHMPLAVVLRNMEEDEVIVEPSDMMQTYRLNRYKWNERLKSKFMTILNNDGGLICMYGIELLLQKEEINNAVNILYHMLKGANRLGESIEKRSIGLMRNVQKVTWK
jgi:hypothetical protein